MGAKINQRQNGFSKEQSKIRVVAVMYILHDGKKHSASEIKSILQARYGIVSDRRTIFSDIYAIDRFIPVDVFYGCKGGFKIKNDMWGEYD